jgi:hypothetical protein
MTTRPFILALLLGCAGEPRPFALRAPFTQDTDVALVSLPCHPDPSDKEPDRVACTPKPYASSYRWDMLDNLTIERASRALSLDLAGEAANVNSFDEVPDSAWFDNRLGAHPMTIEAIASGACKREDSLQDAEGRQWTIDKGKDNGASLGFRVDVPGKGLYALKADTKDQPERNSAASVIGAALYQAAGFTTSCEQIVYVERSQLILKPGLKVVSYGTHYDFDEKALQKVLAESTRRGELSRMQASKWLPGYTLGPFRFEGTRADDPNDIIRHEDRRELRGSRLLAAWMGHWDSKEQNTMDLWMAKDPKQPRSSPGYVRHCILDTSDALGQYMDPGQTRSGHAYQLDFAEMGRDFLTFGVHERPWDRARLTPGHERFGYFSARDFDAERWVGAYPNPAFLRMTERDGAWMARIIARFTPEAVRAIVESGQFSQPGDTAYLTEILIARQHAILARYLSRLSPIADVRREPDHRICAVDLARLRTVFPAARFHYEAVEEIGGNTIALPVTTGADGAVCVAPPSLARDDHADDAPGRRVTIRVRNGIAGPLVIHAYDLGARGLAIAGLTRPAP